MPLDPQELMAAYFTSVIDEAGSDRLAEWITESDVNASAFAQFAIEHHALEHLLRVEKYGDLADLTQCEFLAIDATNEALSERTELQLLSEMEDSMPIVPVVLPEPTEGLFIEKSTIPSGLNWRSKPPAPDRKHVIVIPRPLFWSGIAALLMVGFWISWQFSPQADGPTGEAGVALYETPMPAQPPVVVAMLTAQHNTRWAQSSLAHRSALHAGDRLTLTAGLAEITTNRGAIVLLEAPCTVEMLDDNNAIRLEHGKLVGICETEFSKGLRISTPHMTVTDLSTRFGVQSNPETTEVHVIEGSVAVRQAKTGGTDSVASLRLTTGESARTLGENDDLVRIDHDLSGFASLDTVVTPLRGTGPGLSVDETDQAWQIVAIDDQTFANPIPMAVSISPALVKYFPNKPELVQWLAADPPEDKQGVTRYIIRTKIQLPDDIASKNAVIHVRYVADNLLKSIRVNDTTFDVAGDIPESEYIKREFSKQHAFEIDRGLIGGENTIEFEVIDFFKAVGLRLEWELHQPWIDVNMKP